MHITNSGWAVLGTTIFLMFFLLYVASGTMETLSIQENYSDVPVWSKTPVEIFEETPKVAVKEYKKNTIPLTKNPHFKPFDVKPASVKSYAHDYMMYDYESKQFVQCDTHNDQIRRMRIKEFITIDNQTPMNVTVSVNGRLTYTIPANGHVLMNRWKKFQFLGYDDTLKIVDTETGRVLYNAKVTKLDAVIAMGVAFDRIPGTKKTAMKMTNATSIPLKFWYERRYVGTLNPFTTTLVEPFREGFKGGNTLHFKSEDRVYEKSVVIPDDEYNYQHELTIGRVA